MKIISYMFILVGLASCKSIFGGPSPDERAQVMRKVARSAVIVSTHDGIGSGTAIAREGNHYLILTCQHVTDGDAVVTVITHDGAFKGIVEKEDAASDLALIVATGDLGLEVIQIATQEPDLYDRVYALTSPLGIPFTGSEGVLYSKDRLMGDTAHRWAFTGFIMPGSSGGTVTDSFGKLVCVAEAVVVHNRLIVPELAYCVGLGDIRKFLIGYRLGNTL